MGSCHRNRELQRGSEGLQALPSWGKANPPKEHLIPLAQEEEGVLPWGWSCNWRDCQGNEKCETHQTRKFMVGIQTCVFPCCVLVVKGLLVLVMKGLVGRRAGKGYLLPSVRKPSHTEGA